MTTDIQQMIVDTAHRVFRSTCDADTVAQAAKGTWPVQVWNTLEEQGFTRVDGEGLTWVDALALLQVAGYYAAPVPLAESLLASRLLGAAGLPVPNGVLTIALSSSGVQRQSEAAGHGVRLLGSWNSVPFARYAKHIALLWMEEGQPFVGRVPCSALRVFENDSIAGEPRDRIETENTWIEDPRPLPREVSLQSIQADAAATRVMLAAGALDKMLEMTLEYAGQRKQFGRPIGKFQAVQQQIAEMAAEVAAVRAIANRVLTQVEQPGSREVSSAELSIGIAKIRLSQAIQVSTTIAHQVHGAMGFTEEYPLHHLSRRLWSWRQEFGNETVWAPAVVKALRQRGVWQTVTGV
ncbi:hypothetical protein LLE49_12535 [Alicyclobacillus tolerans]|uniref:acyl-CoA dehydrogenase n=1 Tax=Alicyclobacillus tolerans TaxID=90970 RepID=UPI001F2A6D8B|nr:acyl-CoA dehydrogenase [Alicyclobacillus tolerans]MCF8565544.1 hypothetical protein [Alicyclobacillus tolerans]